ncbi:MAG: type II CRISPR RNA-guided endonuclease Cas9 [Candidatus Nanopelagicales bacterium]
MDSVRYTIGIDVGERSVGCAAIEFDDDGFAAKALALVSNIHDGGEDPASGQSKVSRLASAGVARRTRRLHLRRRKRIERLSELLAANGYVTTTDGDTYDAWHARDELSCSFIEDAEERNSMIATAALHIARHRGWRNPWHGYDRLASSDFPSANLANTLARATDWANVDEGALDTLGQAVSAVLDTRGTKATIRPRGGADEPLMQEQVLASDQLHELRQILETQRLPEDLIDQICRTTFHSEKPHVPTSRIGHDVMPGMKAYPRATRATLEFQEFRIRAFVGNLRLKEAGSKRRLTAEEYDAVVSSLMSWRASDNPKVADIADVLDVKPSAINRDLLDADSLAVPIDRTTRDIEAMLPKRHALRTWWDGASEQARAEWVAAIVDVSDSADVDDDVLSEPLAIMSDDDDAPQLVEKVVDALQSGRTSYSRESLTRLIAHMRETRCDEFVARCEVFDLPEDWREPLPTLDDPIEHPALQRVNTIVRRFIEGCNAKWGQPERVVIEHVRGAFLGPATLQEFRIEAKRNQTRNSNRRKDLETAGVANPSMRDVRRHLSLQRQNSTCLYCGGTIDMTTCQMDHIVPDSLGGANTRENLVAVCRTCNALKGKVSFVEFAATTNRPGVSLEEAVARVRTWQRIDESSVQLRRLKTDVSRRLRMTAADIEDADERSMATTAYAALEMRRRIAGSLEIELARVDVYRGGITREARRAGGVDAMLRVRGEDDKSRFDRRHHAIDAAVITTLYPLTSRTLAERSSMRTAEGLEDDPNKKWREYDGRTKNAREDFELWRQRVGSVADVIKKSLDADRIVVTRPLRLTPSSGRAHLDGIHRLAHKSLMDEWSAAEIDRITDPDIYSAMLGLIGSKTTLAADDARRSLLSSDAGTKGVVSLFPGGGAQTLVRGGAADLGEVHHARVYAWQTKQGFGFGWIRVFAGELRPLGIANGDVLAAALPMHSASMRTANRGLRTRIENGSAIQIGWLTSDDEIELNPLTERLQSGKIGNFLSSIPERRWLIQNFDQPDKVGIAPALLAREGLPQRFTAEAEGGSLSAAAVVNIINKPGVVLAVNVLLQDPTLTVIRRTSLGRPRWNSDSLPVSWSPWKAAERAFKR